jgi:hypothetical protein
MPQVPREPFVPSLLRRMREKLRFQVGPQRAPRVTDDDNDGLAGAPVPKRPYPVTFSGGATLPIPRSDSSSKATELVGDHTG